MTPEIKVIRGLVRGVFDTWQDYEWTVQGFGMLRTYPLADKSLRINVWHSDLAVPNVSTVHDHPWHFTSWVLAGRMTNLLYEQHPAGQPGGIAMMKWRIKTGEGGGPTEAAVPVRLSQMSRHVYFPGDTYTQQAQEIHETKYINGTVSINDRTRLPDGEHAYVFWPASQHWVDAEPRLATNSEVRLVLRAAKEELDATV